MNVSPLGDTKTGLERTGLFQMFPIAIYVEGCSRTGVRFLLTVIPPSVLSNRWGTGSGRRAGLSYTQPLPPWGATRWMALGRVIASEGCPVRKAETCSCFWAPHAGALQVVAGAVSDERAGPVIWMWLLGCVRGWVFSLAGDTLSAGWWALRGYSAHWKTLQKPCWGWELCLGWSPKYWTKQKELRCIGFH